MPNQRGERCMRPLFDSIDHVGVGAGVVAVVVGGTLLVVRVPDVVGIVVEVVGEAVCVRGGGTEVGWVVDGVGAVDF